MEATNTQYMFALDWPGEPPPGTIIAPERYLWSPQPIRSTRKYSVTSYPGISDRQLQPREWRRYLDVPSNISPAVRQLAQSWIEDGPSSAEVVRRALVFFHSQGFRYSLSPGEYRENNLEDFLFNRRTGFCEHYAGSFATLMRLAGIPARVVAGYLGGEYNEIGRFFVVRQSDSHAWCEVWLPEQGWKRVDPTSVVAPDRISLGLNGFLERRAVSVGGNNSTGLVRRISHSSIFNNVRLAWQAANYAWDTRVLSFDEAAQGSLFNTIANTRYDPRSIVIGALAFVCALLAVVFGWIQFHKRKHQDTSKIFYDRFCRKLAGLGISRNPAEGPSDFSMRAAQLLPDRAAQIRHICGAYITLRYSSAADRFTQSEFTNAVKSF
jgi:transglutaminase-like putative cysteine protease